MFLQHLKDTTPQANGQSDLRHLFAYRPASMRHLLAFTQSVMRDGPLPPGECELLAALTSRENLFLFCLGSPGAVAAHFLGEEYVDLFLPAAPRTARGRAFRLLGSGSHVPADETRRHLV